MLTVGKFVRCTYLGGGTCVQPLDVIENLAFPRLPNSRHSQRIDFLASYRSCSGSKQWEGLFSNAAHQGVHSVHWRFAKAMQYELFICIPLNNWYCSYMHMSIAASF